MLILRIIGYGQYTFVSPIPTTSLSCHVNVNERSDQNFRNDVKRAEFMVQIPGCGQCSATLINRNTGQADLGQYFVTSWHCFKTGSNCSGSEFNFSNPITMTFNYQSPDATSHVFQANQTGTVYQVSRQVRLVDKMDCAYGDFALCEILGAPIPPHFNPYYAGWYPSDLLINPLGAPFADIEHPGGSIKKIAEVPFVEGSSTVKQTCSVVTKVIDFLFGWIWGHRWSTQVICTYVQIPFVPIVDTKYEKLGNFSFGTLEDGASGSGLFTTNSGGTGSNRLIGTYSAAFPSNSCALINIGNNYWGKLTDEYYKQSVKNILNPPNKYWVDQGGIPGRQISCYPALNLTAEGGGFNLYPANLYQQDNAIVLNSQTTFSTTGIIIVKNGADFTFQAGQSIDLQTDFSVEQGATFDASIAPSPCSLDNSTYRENEGRPHNLKKMPIPSEKQFDINKYKNITGDLSVSNISKFNVFPNPSRGTVQVELFLQKQENNLALNIYDMYGRMVLAKNYSNVFFIKESLQLPNLRTGVYNLTVRTKDGTKSKKLFITQ